METTIDLTADIIDTRDIIARVEEIRKDRDGYDADALDVWRENYPGDEEELKALEDILDDLKGAGGDEQWEGSWYPVTLIRDSYFEEYARELAQDTCDMGKAEGWPFRHIDWTAAAKELEQDYTTTEIESEDGIKTDYLFR